MPLRPVARLFGVHPQPDPAAVAHAAVRRNQPDNTAGPEGSTVPAHATHRSSLAALTDDVFTIDWSNFGDENGRERLPDFWSSTEASRFFAAINSLLGELDHDPLLNRHVAPLVELFGRLGFQRIDGLFQFDDRLSSRSFGRAIDSNRILALLAETCKTLGQELNRLERLDGVNAVLHREDLALALDDALEDRHACAPGIMSRLQGFLLRAAQWNAPGDLRDTLTQLRDAVFDETVTKFLVDRNVLNRLLLGGNHIHYLNAARRAFQARHRLSPATDDPFALYSEVLHDTARLSIALTDALDDEYLFPRLARQYLDAIHARFTDWHLDYQQIRQRLEDLQKTHFDAGYGPVPVELLMQLSDEGQLRLQTDITLIALTLHANALRQGEAHELSACKILTFEHYGQRWELYTTGLLHWLEQPDQKRHRSLPDLQLLATWLATLHPVLMKVQISQLLKSPFADMTPALLAEILNAQLGTIPLPERESDHALQVFDCASRMLRTYSLSESQQNQLIASLQSDWREQIFMACQRAGTNLSQALQLACLRYCLKAEQWEQANRMLTPFIFDAHSAMLQDLSRLVSRSTLADRLTCSMVQRQDGLLKLLIHHTGIRWALEHDRAAECRVRGALEHEFRTLCDNRPDIGRFSLLIETVRITGINPLLHYVLSNRQMASDFIVRLAQSDHVDTEGGQHRPRGEMLGQMLFLTHQQLRQWPHAVGHADVVMKWNATLASAFNALPVKAMTAAQIVHARLALYRNGLQIKTADMATHQDVLPPFNPRIAAMPLAQAIRTGWGIGEPDSVAAAQSEEGSGTGRNRPGTGLSSVAGSIGRLIRRMAIKPVYQSMAKEFYRNLVQPAGVPLLERELRNGNLRANAAGRDIGSLSGKTLLQLATEEGCNQARELLIRHGAVEPPGR